MAEMAKVLPLLPLLPKQKIALAKLAILAISPKTSISPCKNLQFEAHVRELMAKRK
jgi:hypothetical protein